MCLTSSLCFILIIFVFYAKFRCIHTIKIPFCVNQVHTNPITWEFVLTYIKANLKNNRVIAQHRQDHGFHNKLIFRKVESPIETGTCSVYLIIEPICIVCKNTLKISSCSMMYYAILTPKGTSYKMQSYSDTEGHNLHNMSYHIPFHGFWLLVWSHSCVTTSDYNCPCG